jgi:hypothetical protein
MPLGHFGDVLPVVTGWICEGLVLPTNSAAASRRPDAAFSDDDTRLIQTWDGRATIECQRRDPTCTATRVAHSRASSRHRARPGLFHCLALIGRGSAEASRVSLPRQSGACGAKAWARLVGAAQTERYRLLGQPY